MKRFIEETDRTQLALLPESLDDYIGESNPVRAIEAFVAHLDLAELGFNVVPEATGRPGYHPSVLLMLYTYGYLNRISSSRCLEREAGRNLEVIWLLGRLVPDDKVIADFRKDNGAAIKKVCVRFVELCRQMGLLMKASVAIDGSKFKAVNNRDKNFTRNKIDRRRAQLEESVLRYLRQLETADRQEPTEALAVKAAHLKEKLAKPKEEMGKLDAHEKRMLASPDGQISLTDPDSRSMATSGRGSGVVGYNVQVGPDGSNNFVVYNQADTGMYIQDGQTGWTANSDARLKTNITPLASSTLDAVLALNPITFNWKDSRLTGTRLGFIAQNVQSQFPQLVAVGGTTTIQHADGSSEIVTHTLGVDYTGLVVPIVQAIKDIASITGTFKANLIAWLGDAANGIDKIFAHEIIATNGTFTSINTRSLTASSSVADTLSAGQKLCVGTVCVTPEQFQAMVAAAGAPGSGASNTGSPAAVPEGGTNGPPIITINGGNPATIQVGTTYADLGALITGPQGDLNLGIITLLDGATTTQLTLDTSAPSTHTIQYTVTDQSGLTGSAQRTVIVTAPANDNQATSTPPASNDNTPTVPLAATGTEATTSSQ